MAIKLKKLNKDFGVGDPYIKTLSILLMVLSASIFLETIVFLFRDRFYLFKDIFTNYGWYEIRKFILFGPGVYMDNIRAALGILSITVISFVLTILSFKVYKKNLNTKTFFSRFAIFLYKKSSVEIPLLLIIVCFLFFVNSMHRQIYMYDK